MTEDSDPQFTFRTLTRDDLPLLRRWHDSEHVRAWWGELDEAEYFDAGPVDRFIALMDGQAVGTIQCYRWGDFPDEARVVGGRPGELGLDYLLGEAELIGRGLGPAMLRSFLNQEALRGNPVNGIRIDVAEANRRSWRCLEKLGFKRVASGIEIAGEPGPHYVYLLPAPTPA